MTNLIADFERALKALDKEVQHRIQDCVRLKNIAGLDQLARELPSSYRGCRRVYQAILELEAEEQESSTGA